MARRERIDVEIKARDRASANIRKVEGRLKGFGKALGAMKGYLIAGTAALAGLTAGFAAAIRASAKQELAITKLNASLSSLGDEGLAISKDLQEYAAALQQITTAGDEVIIEGQALIASFTKNTDEIKAATQAALDLSAATGTNLQSAFLLMGRAASGETSTLSRYGIQLDKGIPQAEKFAAALAKIQEQFGGQAQARVKTFTGAMEQLSNAWGDLLEAVGDSITKNESAIGSLQSLKGLFEGLIPLARRTGDLMQELGQTLWNLALPLRAVARATGFLTDKWLEFTGATDVVGARVEAVEATAKRFGTTVEELGEHIEKSKEKIEELDDSAVKLGDTFDEDAQSFLSFTDGLRKMETVADAASTQIDTLDESIEMLPEAVEEARRTFDVVNETLAVVGQTARLTAAQFDALSASAGRAAAVSAAVEGGGGRLIQGGTRVRLAGGGSRLTTTPRIGGGFFSPQKRSYVKPGGGVVFT